MRIGIFGGSFDPVHFGHLLLAELCAEACALDRVWFIPAGVPPHKSGKPLASDTHRIEMLRLAIAGNRRFEVNTLEVDRGGVSFTVDTLHEIRRQHPSATLFFLMGADSLADLPKWRQPEEICNLAQLAIVQRPHSPPPDLEAIKRLIPADVPQPHIVWMPAMGLSSSEIRGRVAQGQSIRYWLPRSVQKYLETHGLYQRPKASGRNE